MPKFEIVGSLERDPDGRFIVSAQFNEVVVRNGDDFLRFRVVKGEEDPFIADFERRPEERRFSALRSLPF